MIIHDIEYVEPSFAAELIKNKVHRPALVTRSGLMLFVAIIAEFSWYMLGLSPGAAILLGGILAPTDSVLAMDVKTRSPENHSQLRFNFACEAGMNDDTAFTLVMLGFGMLGLHSLGRSGLQWMLLDVLWATIGGIILGIAAGVNLGRVGWILRREPHCHELLDDFLGLGLGLELGLIGFVYGVSGLIHVWGFVAVFFAAVALRQTEPGMGKSFRASILETATHEPAHNADVVDMEPEPPTTISEGSLVFKEHLERLSMVSMILLLGGTLFRDSWSWEAVGLALFVPVLRYLSWRPRKTPAN